MSSAKSWLQLPLLPTERCGDKPQGAAIDGPEVFRHLSIRAGVGKSSIINALRFNALADDGDGPSCSGEDEDEVDVNGAAAERLDSHSHASTSAPGPDDGYREAATRPMRAPSGTIGDADGFQVSTAPCCIRALEMCSLDGRTH